MDRMEEFTIVNPSECSKFGKEAVISKTGKLIFRGPPCSVKIVN
jgi:hypothetical protein